MHDERNVQHEHDVVQGMGVIPERHLSISHVAGGISNTIGAGVGIVALASGPIAPRVLLSDATSGSFWGRITINCIVVEYRAYPLPSDVD